MITQSQSEGGGGEVPRKGPLPSHLGRKAHGTSQRTRMRLIYKHPKP